MLNIDDTIYIIHYEEYVLEIYKITGIFSIKRYKSEYCYAIQEIINPSNRYNKWIEHTLNLNKLIKNKFNKTFITCNEKLAVKKLEILLKYKEKC